MRYAAVVLSAGLAVGMAPANSAEHVVVAGETLSGIAQAHGFGMRELALHNGIRDVDHIVVGQVLVLPDNAAGATSHQVAGGDTLAGIAASYGVTVGALVEANSIANPNLIQIGETLTIPGRGAPTDARRGPNRVDDHAVAPGDTLARIAARYGVTVAALAEANDIADPDLIVIGTILTVGPDRQDEPAGDRPALEEPPDDRPGGPATRTHTVAPGDTMAHIAARYGVTVAALAEANGIVDRNLVVVGTVLSVPAGPPEPEPEREPRAPSDERVVGTNIAPRLDFWANEYGVPADLFKALTWFESGWNNGVVSEVGAVGIGQLMPTTVDFVSRYLLGQPIDPTDADQNMQASARYLRYLLDQTDNRPSQAVAAYYQGLTSLRRDGVFESSRFYVDGILALRSSF